MKPTGLLVACVVLFGLGGLVWWTKQNPKKPESTVPDAPKVLALGEDQIEELHFSKPGSEPIVLKKSGGKWQITAPAALPADQETLKGLVSSLASLQSDRLIDQKPADLAVFGLTEPKQEIDVVVSGGRAVVVEVQMVRVEAEIDHRDLAGLGFDGHNARRGLDQDMVRCTVFPAHDAGRSPVGLPWAVKRPA